MAGEDLDEALRRSDPDRWLAARFIADPLARADVVALWAFDHELARAERIASNPLISEIRLTWWREALAEMFGGQHVRRHPVAQALASVVRRRDLPRPPLDGMIDGRLAALNAEPLPLAPARDWALAVGGGAALAAARILDPAAPAEAVVPAGEVWGLLLLRRSGRAQGADLDRDIADRLRIAGRAAVQVSPAAFPAIVCATLARRDLRRGETSVLERCARMVWAVMTGRL